MIIGLATLPALASWYWLPGQEPVRNHSDSHRQNLAGPAEPVELPDTDRRMRQLERRMRALQTELTAIPPPNEAPAVLQAEPAESTVSSLTSAAALDPDAEIALRLDQLNNRLLTQAPDVAETVALRGALTEKLARAGLERVRVTTVDCFQTLCKFSLDFDGVQSRDSDLASSLMQLDDGYFAHVASGDATSAEVYASRKGYELFDDTRREL
jgi:hypothetical protein